MEPLLSIANMASPLLLFLFYLVSTTIAEPVYENSTGVCQRCTCTTSEDAQTLNLDCSDQNFFYMLANWPEHNSTIRASFAGNNFTYLERLPETDGALEVVLSRCNIHYISRGAFESTIRVKFVDLSYNYVTFEELTSDRFRGPFDGNRPESIAIEDLNLAYNQIHSLHKDVFQFLPNLTRLNLEGNDFVVLDVHTQLALSGIKSLTSLNLANNDLTELITGAIGGLENLSELDLSRNSLDFVPYSLKDVQRSLRVLILDDNPILELTSETFTGLRNLTEIFANNLTRLERIGNHTFASTPKLTKLSICNNTRLSDIDPEAFSPDSKLKEFYVSNNDLNGLPFALLKWDSLDVLDFNDNPFRCNCDLYKISNSSSAEIKRNLDGPTCVDPRNHQRRQVYALDGDICSAKARKSIRRHHISIQIIGLSVVVMTGFLVAMTLAYSKWRKFMQKTSTPFASQVFYSPLLNPRT